jgi:hypothetical protein
LQREHLQSAAQLKAGVILKATVVMLLCLMTFPSLSQSTSEYTVGTITAVVPHQSATNPDTSATSYDVSLKVGGTVYVVLYTPPWGMETVRFAIGQDVSLLVGKQTITFNDLLGNSSEVPILSRAPVETQSNQASGAPLPQPPTKGTALVGLAGVKENTGGTLTVKRGKLYFAHSGGTTDLAAAEMEDVVTGDDSQSVIRGTLGTLSMFGPYGSGRVLSLFRSKIDTLTIQYRDAEGALHGVVFTLPLGTAESVKKELLTQGAHTSIAAPAIARVDVPYHVAEEKP